MANHTEPLTLVNSQYTLGYGMRLDKGTAPELVHPHVSVTLPDGSEGNMTLHVINGTPDEIKADCSKASMRFSTSTPTSEKRTRGNRPSSSCCW